MTGLPVFVSTRAFDAAQGRDTDEDYSEEDWIFRALDKLHVAAEMLASVEHSSSHLTDTCHEAAEAVAKLRALIKEALP